MTPIRPAVPGDAAAVAAIWEQGWRDGHLGHVPEALVRVRTHASFGERAPERIGDTRVAVVDGEVAGFVMVVDDEVEQVYVDRVHRGTSVAGDLLDHAAGLVAAAGHRRAWLAVAAGNERARRFYARRGWRDEGAFDYLAEGPDGPIPVPCRRFVLDL